MNYLLDTNILSESRKREPNPGVREWISATPPEHLYISVLTIGEIGRCVTRLRERRDVQQAAAFERWLDEMAAGFADRVLTVDIAVSRRWATQSVAQPLPVSDALISATAAAHDLILVTRNVKDFERSGIQVVNPYDDGASVS